MSAGKLPLLDVLDRWDGLVESWELEPLERCALLGRIDADFALDPSGYGAAAAEERMRLLVELAPLVEEVIGEGSQVRAWLRRPNPRLAGRTPVQALSASTEWARWLIDALGSAS